jgi:hypothetical protein
MTKVLPKSLRPAERSLFRRKASHPSDGPILSTENGLADNRATASSNVRSCKKQPVPASLFLK